MFIGLIVYLLLNIVRITVIYIYIVINKYSNNFSRDSRGGLFNCT